MTDVQGSEQLTVGRVLPVVVLDDARHADPLASALVKGGLAAIEVTLRTAAGLDAIAAVAGRGDLTVGAGTVLTVAQAERAVAAGARFVVTPGFAPAVVRFCQEAGVPVFPGAATATEIQMALDAGLNVVKFFPAQQLGGTPMIKALSAPFRDVRFIPTGGITPAVIDDYLALPAVLAVGATWMVASDLVAAERWDEITSRTASAVAAAESRGGTQRSGAPA
ncbi:bifunctional 4-hydroxy-2-oxoglutarate aldolase/2-dehydro-3-deoxy-phosphogluconate aldolase [Micromonospora craniellae]|uniref:2-dehydro-3-deoxy-phosphogluconate aldolase n=1 Tax=Micromonospora craniellae TaxID=2294034 RepID=A0A372FYC0_9ACTN|nr:bifunctional 4-hydroxy-2-oxoglutarate aldolase/2-dehydro-3-deoxy-phosphogluconate aldolase [Micromonospora craniellae]QOC91539.1 bifunctional 4-hydroxy-2-oxoglutarate aldolase/2-dehydro-3-deoxy-phosphogluconate aldolase [Micromonospora craniellae]RFS45490.1 bifunctional 4-hydroxy-2-oxoglutarate aldolase/2-dehydro-3-deoxy-phosphogluconate aldolase [Micromonospora craniellae]